MFETRKVTAEIFSTMIAMMPAVYRRRAPDFRALNLRLSSAKLQIF